MTTPAANPSADLEARFNAFLRLLDEPFGGKAVFAHYVAHARVAYMQDLRPIAEVGDDAYALGLAAAAMVHDENHPGVPRRPVIPAAVLIGDAEEADGRRVAWFKATEAVDGRTLYVAAGFERGHDGAWRIGWLTLAPKPEAWTYADGLVQALADFPFVHIGDLAVPRSWLDLAWHRLHGHPRPALGILPEARFACHGSGACCVKGFNTFVPAEAQPLLDAIPWERHAPRLVGTKLEPAGDGRLRLKHQDDDCRFLEAGRCLLHSIVGRSVFPICTIYPVLFQETPDGVAVALSPACPSARANLGPPLADRTEDLYARYAMRNPGPAEAWRLEADGPDDWAAYKAAEAGVLAQLARTELPLARRLWLGSRWLDHAATGSVPDDLDDEPAPQAEDPDGNRLALLAGLATAFSLPLPEGDGLEPRPLGPEREAMLANVFRNQLHAKAFGAKWGLRVAHHVNVLGWMVACYAAARYGDEAPPEKLYWQVGTALMHGALGHLLETNEALRGMVADPGFGSWMLGDPPPFRGSAG